MLADCFGPMSPHPAALRHPHTHMLVTQANDAAFKKILTCCTQLQELSVTGEQCQWWRKRVLMAVVGGAASGVPDWDLRFH